MMNFKPQALDMETLRAQAANSIGYTPAVNSMEASAISKRRDEAALSYVELTTEDLRELIEEGDLVRYDRRGYGFLDGVVMELCATKDLARVRFDDQWGVRYYWMALNYLTLRLKASAREVGNGEAG